MLLNEIYEEYFLNSTLSMFTTNLGGFVSKYAGLDISSNCIFPLYEKNDGQAKNKIIAIESFLFQQGYSPIFRLVYQDNYEELDRILFSRHYEKLDNGIVVACNLSDKKESLFRYADFNENGIFIDVGIHSGDEFLDDYFYLKNMDKEEQYLFNKTIDMIPFEKFALSLVEEQHLLGQAYFIQQDDIVIIKDITVSNKYRALGYSTKILYSILTYCAKNNIHTVLSEISSSNEAAINLFESNPMFDKLYDIFYKHLPQKKGRFIFD